MLKIISNQPNKPQTDLTESHLITLAHYVMQSLRRITGDDALQIWNTISTSLHSLFKTVSQQDIINLPSRAHTVLLHSLQAAYRPDQVTKPQHPLDMGILNVALTHLFNSFKVLTLNSQKSKWNKTQNICRKMQKSY